jgi:hypothetical protein
MVAATAFVFSAALAGETFAYSSSAGASTSAHYHPVSKRAVARPQATTATRPEVSPVVVSGSGDGQAGYVHYFVLTDPQGELESMVGLELPGNRIAWSFPEIGVSVSPFVSRGSISVNGREYQVEHLYGLPPPRTPEAMHALQRDLPGRVEWWLSHNTPYCDEASAGTQFCVSCLGFVLRVLYPGTSPEIAVLPADFKPARKGMYTTEDLLLYLAGVRTDVPRQARLKQIAGLNVPDAMREELVRITRGDQVADTARTAGATTRPAAEKSRSPARSVVQAPKKPIVRKRT